MAKNTYETLLILDSNEYTRDPGGIAKTVDGIITEAGGNVLVSRLWMQEKLAYPIKKHQKGAYWLVYFEGEGDVVKKLDRAFLLSEPVLRQLTLKLEARLVEPILANARGQGAASESTETEETKATDTSDSAATQAKADDTPEAVAGA